MTVLQDLVPSRPLTFLAGGGEMGELIRHFDWSSSPLGPPSGWPGELRTLVQVMLTSRQPMFIAWGPERTMIYNDGYAPMCAHRHPWALGQPFDKVWADIIQDVGPIMDAAYSGVPTYMDDIEFQMLRHGQAVETHFSFGYTPVHDEDDRVVGMFCTALEITAEVKQAKARGVELRRIRELLEKAPSFMAVLTGPEHVFELTNAAYMQLIDHRDVIGKSVREAFPDIVGQGFYELLDSVYQTGEPFIGRGLEIDLQASPGAKRQRAYLDFIYQPIRDEGGRITGVFVEGSDVTEQKRAEIALRESELRAKLALAAAEMGVWECQVVDGRFQSLVGDDRAITLLGGTPGESSSFESFAARLHVEDRLRLAPAAMAALAEGSDGILDVEYRVGLPDGAFRWVHARAQALFDGDAVRFVGTVRDVSAEKDAEAQEQLLSSELQHRVKNTLAMVSAIATQTLRGDQIQEQRESFGSRLAALANAHDILTARTWQGAPIRSVIEGALAPHGSGDQFVLRGGHVELSARQALSMALTIHELATNAAKYGALSAPDGSVEITWMAEGDDVDRQFIFRWQEVGGPEVHEPTRKGFGSRMITRVLAADFNGSVSIDFEAAGVTCILASPISNLLPLNPGLSESAETL